MHASQPHFSSAFEQKVCMHLNLTLAHLCKHDQWRTFKIPTTIYAMYINYAYTYIYTKLTHKLSSLDLIQERSYHKLHILNHIIITVEKKVVHNNYHNNFMLIVHSNCTIVTIINS